MCQFFSYSYICRNMELCYTCIEEKCKKYAEKPFFITTCKLCNSSYILQYLIKNFFPFHFLGENCKLRRKVWPFHIRKSQFQLVTLNQLKVFSYCFMESLELIKDFRNPKRRKVRNSNFYDILLCINIRKRKNK